MQLDAELYLNNINGGIEAELMLVDVVQGNSVLFSGGVVECKILPPTDDFKN